MRLDFIPTYSKPEPESKKKEKKKKIQGNASTSVSLFEHLESMILHYIYFPSSFNQYH